MIEFRKMNLIYNLFEEDIESCCGDVMNLTKDRVVGGNPVGDRTKQGNGPSHNRRESVKGFVRQVASA